MNPSQSPLPTKLRVGVFSIAALILVGGMTVFVNDRPYWWKSCKLVRIVVDDATGLKAKSPVRSMGLEIGYLKEVEFHDQKVRLNICVTAEVEVLEGTLAYIRGEGFLGDKFVELKPVKYKGKTSSLFWRNFLITEAHAEQALGKVAGSGDSPKDVPLGSNSQDFQQLVNQVDGLITELTGLTTNLKSALNPQELRTTVQQLNKTLENASKVLAPEGNLNTTASRVLAKLEDAIEQLRDQITRINRGEGSLGRLLNDPVYADEIHLALKNVNRLLDKVGHIRFIVDIFAHRIGAYEGTRGGAHLGIWPGEDRYYLLGVASDPRKSFKKRTVTSVAGGQTTVVETTEQEHSPLVLTGMIGKVFMRRLELAVGFLYGDGTASAAYWFGPRGQEEKFQVRMDAYARANEGNFQIRSHFTIRPWYTLYFRGGFESFRKVNDEYPWFVGGGISFDDEDIKLLFTLL